MWKYEYECDHANVDMQSGPGAEISSSSGELLKSLTWRDRRHKKSEATNDDECKAWLDSNSQHDEAKWQGYFGSAAVWLITPKETRLPRHHVATAMHGMKAVATVSPTERCGDEEKDSGEADWKSTTIRETR